MKLTFTKKGLMRVSIPIILVSVVLSSLILLSSSSSADYETESVFINATVTHVIGVTASVEALDRGIIFPSSNAGVNDVDAENNTNNATRNCTEYNISADSANTDTINLFHYATNLTNLATPSDYILIGNVTHEANSTEPDGTSNVNMSNPTIHNFGDIQMPEIEFASIGNGNCTSIAAGSKCHIAYWLDVPTVTSGSYNSTYFYCGNSTHSSTACA